MFSIDHHYKKTSVFTLYISLLLSFDLWRAPLIKITGCHLWVLLLSSSCDTSTLQSSRSERSAMFEMRGERPECVFKRLAYMCFLQERRRWKKGYFIVLIFKSFDKKIKKASEKSYGRSFSLSLFRSLCLSLSHSWVIRFHWGFPLQHASLSFLSLVRRTSHLFPLSRHCCFQKTQFLLITLHRVAALGGGHRRQPSTTGSSSSELCYSLTHDKFRPLLFINRMENRKTKNKKTVV